MPSILTRVKLDSSSDRVRNGKVAHPVARVPDKPWGSVPKTPLGAFAPTSLPDRRRAHIQRGIERGNNMHEIKEYFRVILHHIIAAVLTKDKIYLGRGPIVAKKTGTPRPGAGLPPS